ncbi:MAG: phenylalanine 4-monooxygenase [Paracoccaceae bacterium]|nr:phenylalanine 4-monooxygenase [Paracoccaceae bacterium]
MRKSRQVLMDQTGWQVEPVPALIGFSQFFGMLSKATFPAASFIRGREDFDYIEEPDIFHEIYGHTPLLTDPRFAKFSQKIGETGTKCDKSEYSWLIRLYWFTVEFGLIREGHEIKALGSGLASSPGELDHSINEPTVVRKPFDIIDILRTPYRIDINQPIYFVLENVDQLLEAAERDLVTDIRHAKALGLHAPSYPPKNKGEQIQ